MKKNLIISALAVFICFSLAACGNQSKSSKDSSISSLKAENSSLKAKKHSSHKDSEKHSKKDSSTASSSSTANSKSNSESNAKSVSQMNTNQASSTMNNGSTNQTSANSHTGDWHHDPELWDAVNNADYSGTIYENATPQERYDYLWAQADHSQP